MATLVDQQAPVAHILNSLGDGVYVTDRDRRILYWSSAAERLTGWLAGEVVGRTCYDNILAHTDKNGALLCGKESCPLHRAIQTGETSEVPFLMYARTRSGQRIPIQASVAPMRDEKGQVIGGVETFRDMTEMVGDLERAKTIQQQVMQCSLPEDPRVRIRIHCVQSDLLGGDFYRAERLADGRYALMIADVMGHGSPAALHAVQLRALWETSRNLLGQPGAFLTRVNEQLNRLIGGGMHFATALHLVIDLDAHQVTWSSAGHSAPICYGSLSTDEAADSSLPLGLWQDSVYSDVTKPCRAGDRLLLFTDGSVEVTTPEGNQIGRDGLVQILGQLGYPDVNVDLREVQEHLLARSRDLRLPDDVTFIDVSIHA